MAAVSGPASVESHEVRRLNSNAHPTGSRTGGLVHGRMHLPPERGRHTSRSLENRRSRAFARFNSHARPPADHAPLAPLRDDVPLLDPCSGQLSAGAEVTLGIRGRQKFIDFHHVSSDLWGPPGLREGPQTPRKPHGLAGDVSGDKTWNSRRISDAALRARLGGWTSPVKVKPESQRTPPNVKFTSFFPDKGSGTQDARSSDPRERPDHAKAVRRFIYTSATQRSYEDINWDTKLPQRVKAPETTLEKMADPVSQRSSQTRYHGQPQLCSSPCRQSGQIPLYCGTIGSENMDNIDNMDGDFHPLTLQRNTLPPYTPTAYRTTIPGYAGKGVYAKSGPDTEDFVTSLSIPAHSTGTNMELRTPGFGRTGPLSRMVTTRTPWNPFLNPQRPVLPI
ncbi:protein SPMIP7 [Polymixia lowei]